MLISGLRQLLTIDSPLKNSLIRNLWLILKFIASQTRQQIIIAHILPNIPRSKSNQAMKFGQIKKYSVTKIFLQKSWIISGRETSSKPYFIL